MVKLLETVILKNGPEAHWIHYTFLMQVNLTFECTKLTDLVTLNFNKNISTTAIFLDIRSFFFSFQTQSSEFWLKAKYLRQDKYKPCSEPLHISCINDAPPSHVKKPGIHLSPLQWWHVYILYIYQRGKDNFSRSYREASRRWCLVALRLALQWMDGWNIPFVNRVKYLDVNFDRIITWRLSGRSQGLLNIYLNMLRTRLGANIEIPAPARQYFPHYSKAYTGPRTACGLKNSCRLIFRHKIMQVRSQTSWSS